jgi:hypothetical protein
MRLTLLRVDLVRRGLRLPSQFVPIVPQESTAQANRNPSRSRSVSLGTNFRDAEPEKRKCKCSAERESGDISTSPLDDISFVTSTNILPLISVQA